MAQPDDDIRAALLAAAEAQLVASLDSDIATRAVCEAAGVTQPVLYRIFGDKRGLLDALADAGLERYAARKAELEVTDDPAEDLRRGWDDHLSFAQEHAALYQLMFAPRPWASSRARDGVIELLRRTLSRCAAAGVLRVEIDVAQAMLLAANVGLALNRMADPASYAATGVSDALRDAVMGSVLDDDGSQRGQEDAGAAARRQIRAQLRMDPPSALLPEETALMTLWLNRLD
ncbi:TetR/AcrR family transcriptional regulator [Microbacterium sp. JB110]|uniref:TetR/AcrR family transcriptional regulator n=1 Tax=Microbacterium sp. JB110 TaxID=2024477 RepID=UPI00097E89BE|nr:TetR/AcrR family transcriptional regulator [Microbacterium sp. JB110]RCS60392.1 TetR/AcrR family transcriptional regulator [Microbacterium sp. JB110]SJM49404.1 Transcriptional regulator, TetR family [Frigoribacterium sp. JB110]